MQRRTFIKNSSLTVISISAFGGLNWNGKNFEGDNPTTTDILGPFYRPGAPLRNNLRMAGSNGTPVILKELFLKKMEKPPSTMLSLKSGIVMNMKCMIMLLTTTTIVAHKKQK